MTIYHRKIIKYMQLKGELAGPLFFSDRDAAAITKWKPIIAEYAWRSLEDNIKLLSKSGISPWTCPFCILNFFNHCEHCEWARTHGLCKTKGTDIWKIKNEKKFTNDFYRTILKEANKL